MLNKKDHQVMIFNAVYDSLSFHFSPDSHQAFTNLLVENSKSLSLDLGMDISHFYFPNFLERQKGNNW